MEMVLRRMKIEDATVHGFRSSFRDWAGNVSNFPREVTETALAHVIGDKAEQAYRRGDALEKRRKLMEAWAAYCSASPRDRIGKGAKLSNRADRTASRAIQPHDYRIRWVASRCRVSLATAETIIANAGFAVRERR
jgi:hypothetical protein